MNKNHTKSETTIRKVIYDNIDNTMSGIDKSTDLKKITLIHRNEAYKNRDMKEEKDDISNNYQQHISVLLDHLFDKGFVDDYFKDIDEDERVNIINSQIHTESENISISSLSSSR